MGSRFYSAYFVGSQQGTMGMSDHIFDLHTHFCVRCGRSREAVVDYTLDCLDLHTRNVIAISHLRAHMRLVKVLDPVMNRIAKDFLHREDT